METDPARMTPDELLDYAGKWAAGVDEGVLRTWKFRRWFEYLTETDKIIRALIVLVKAKGDGQ